MTKLMNRFRRVAGRTSLIEDERGLSTVEYVIILVLIAAASVGTWQALGTTIKTKLGNSEATISSAQVP